MFTVVAVNVSGTGTSWAAAGCPATATAATTNGRHPSRDGG